MKLAVVFFLGCLGASLALQINPKVGSLNLKHRTLRKDKIVDVKESPNTIPVAPPLPLNKASYSFAVDLSSSASVSNFQCLVSNGYKAAFLRVYQPSGSGSVDTTGINNVINAASARIGTEVYVTPQPLGSKQGYQQFDEVYSALQNKGITVKTIWLQATSPVNWYTSQQSNINFITSFVQRALQYGVTPGIYTNSYDWSQITSSWTGLNSFGTVYLWYWNVLGQGVSGESVPDFSDFRAFGGWIQPNVKQFAQSESLCGLTLNRDIYPSGSNSKNVVKAVEGEAKVQVGCIVSDC